jgi:hypothetical protein
MLRDIPEDRRPQEHIDLATWGQGKPNYWKGGIFSFTSNGGKWKKSYGLI